MGERTAVGGGGQEEQVGAVTARVGERMGTEAGAVQRDGRGAWRAVQQRACAAHAGRSRGRGRPNGAGQAKENGNGKGKDAWTAPRRTELSTPSSARQRHAGRRACEREQRSNRMDGHASEGGQTDGHASEAVTPFVKR